MELFPITPRVAGTVVSGIARVYGDAHDRDDMYICRKCGDGLTARDVLDGETPCAEQPDAAQVRDALIEGVKLEARNLMRGDSRVWHEALESALDKTLPGFWSASRATRS